jgi:hypothetical protein
VDRVDRCTVDFSPSVDLAAESCRDQRRTVDLSPSVDHSPSLPCCFPSLACCFSFILSLLSIPLPRHAKLSCSLLQFFFLHELLLSPLASQARGSNTSLCFESCLCLRSSSICTSIKHLYEHQASVRASSICTSINHLYEHQPSVRASTICTSINHLYEHQPSVRASTICTSINHLYEHQLSVRASTICTSINHLYEHQLSVRASTLYTVHWNDSAHGPTSCCSLIKPSINQALYYI